MKTLSTRIGILLVILTVSCNKINPDHPQSFVNQPQQQIDEKYILNYTDSIDALIPELEKQESLLYTLGDYSFHITRYSENTVPVLYIEHGDSGEYGNTEKRYYLKDGYPVMYSETQKSTEPDRQFHAERAFFRNEVLFYAEKKDADTEDGLKSSAFTESDTLNIRPKEKLAKLEDALNQRGKFNLVFIGIIEYPQAKYLILSRNEVNAYRAAVLIKNEDELVREISMNPEKYRGRKLLIDWKLSDNDEAVYVSGALE